ncbi:MAG: type IV pilus twitching motility protein PilT [Thermodesulfobacteriota bacterium]|nr:type IV pilus twitching motility protein PilT [Thermodesulfobacteriota bacterium]
MNISEYLKVLITKGGSDLHLKVSRPPLMRIKGELFPSEYPPIQREEMRHLILPMLTEIQVKKLEAEKELDFSFQVEGLARFRGNLFHQMGSLGAVFRVIPVEIKTIDQLGLPQVLKELVSRNQGIILVTGPTGSGKSTTLAAMIDYLNENRFHHIMTIEDPVEFVHQDKRCVINQREIGFDTRSFSEALRRALRQDPDVILVGEMRDPETITIAMTAAETGHLVFSTLHTNDAKQSVDRIIDTFPPDQQHQVRMQLAMTLSATVSQRLIKKSDGSGRVAVLEVMINTPTIRKMIEEGKIGAIDKAIHDSASLYKMQTMNQDLFRLVKEGVITKEDALSISNNPNDLRIIFQTQMPGPSPASPPHKPPGMEGRHGKS